MHDHNHNHDHGHHHHHHEITNVNTAFIIGIILNTAFLITEAVIGFSTHSLALISDAGHNATDVFSLLLSLFAFRMMKVKASSSYTYGYKKLSILSSLINAILLVITTGVIFYEGFERIHSPVIIQGKTISLVAFVGIIVNGTSAWLFFKGKEKDINVKGAYLHLLGDALVSLGVVISGIIIYYTGWNWLDTVISFAIGFIILIATWRLLTDSIRLALDGVPSGIDIEEAKRIILACKAVTDVHHIHVWALSSSENAMTAHLVIDPSKMMEFDEVKNKIKHDLFHIDIHHTTFEVEFGAKSDSCTINED